MFRQTILAGSLTLVFLSPVALGDGLAARGPAPEIARQGELALAAMAGDARTAISDPDRIRAELCAALRGLPATQSVERVAACPVGATNRSAGMERR